MFLFADNELSVILVGGIFCVSVSTLFQHTDRSEALASTMMRSTTNRSDIASLWWWYWIYLTCFSWISQRGEAFVPPRDTYTSSSVSPTSRKIPSIVVVLFASSSPQRDNNNKKKNGRLDKGFNLLELANGIVPQGAIVKTAKEGWKFAWKRMMAELAPQDKTGSYQRPSYSFVSNDDDQNNNDNKGLIMNDLGRYHLYVGNPCPWCHRTKLALAILDIPETAVGVTLLEDNPTKASRGGWVFATTRPDPLGHKDLRQLYDALVPSGSFQGRCTAPLLIDKKRRCIISNESSDIVRLFNQATFFREQEEEQSTTTTDMLDLYPADKAAEIDTTNDWVYTHLNNGVYRCGFSTTQAAYDDASSQVRMGLDRAERILSQQPYLCGDTFTESDLRLLPTMLRFDGAYAPLFKAGGAHLRIRSDYPAIQDWLKRCWTMPSGGVAASNKTGNTKRPVSSSIDLADACGSYYKQLFPLNPGGILPTPVSAKELGLE